MAFRMRVTDNSTQPTMPPEMMQKLQILMALRSKGKLGEKLRERMAADPRFSGYVKNNQMNMASDNTPNDRVNNVAVQPTQLSKATAKRRNRRYKLNGGTIDRSDDDPVGKSRENLQTLLDGINNTIKPEKQRRGARHTGIHNYESPRESLPRRLQENTNQSRIIIPRHSNVTYEKEVLVYDKVAGIWKIVDSSQAHRYSQTSR